MGWGFEAACPDCGHGWEGVESSLRIGLGSDSTPSDSKDVFCPHCCNRLYYPRSMERKVWQRWYERFLRQFPFQSGWLVSLLARIDASFQSAPWYAPQALNLGEVTCPGCDRRMAPGIRGGDRLICPRCGSNAPVLSGFTSHVTLALGEDGFV